MKLLVLADIDDLRWRGGSGRADLLLALGDMTDAVILQAAAGWQCPAVFAVKGNHDSAASFPAPIVDLHLRSVNLGGLSFGGLNGCLQYKPRGIHDREDEVHTGFTALNAYIERAAPRLLLHGHQHQERESLVGRTRVVGVFGWSVIEV